MKKLSFSLVAVLAIVLSVASAFTTKTASQWYELKNKQVQASLDFPLQTSAFETPVTAEPEICQGQSSVVCAILLDDQSGIFADQEITNETELNHGVNEEGVQISYRPVE